MKHVKNFNQFLNEAISNPNWKQQLTNYINTKMSLSNGIGVFVVDTSAAIPDNDLYKIENQLKTIKSLNDLQRIYIIGNDDDISNTNSCYSEKDIDLLSTKKGIHTSVSNYNSAFKWVDKNVINNGEDLSFIVFITDGYGSIPKNTNYNDKILWLVIGNEKANLSIGEIINF
jgi:predicted metal-dependent peptidase